MLVFSTGVQTAQAQENSIVRRGEPVTITAILLYDDNYGIPASSQLIEFFDETGNVLLGIDTTDSNGMASIDWTVPLIHPLGPTLINATFRGNSSLFLLPSTQWFFLYIMSSVHLVVNSPDSSLAPGDRFSFTVLLLDDTDSPIENANLVVTSGSTVLATSITNSTGMAAFTVNCNESWSVLGENILQIVHYEDFVNFYAAATESITITIQQIPTSINVIDYPEEVVLGDNASFTVNLLGNGNALSSDVGIFMDGEFLYSITTDSFGSCLCNFNVDASFFPGFHTLRLVYDGTYRYSNSFTSFEFRITSPVFLDIDIPVFLTIGNTSQLIVSLFDHYSRSFNDTIIKFTDATNGLNDTQQVFYSSPISTILFPVFGPPGIHSIRVELVNPFITNNTCSIFLTVWSKPILAMEESSILSYASPNQEAVFSFKMTNWTGNCSNRSLHVLINNLHRFSKSTDSDGIATFNISAPSSEGICNVSIVYLGDTGRYELNAKYEYLFMVSYSIPTRLELIEYEVVPPFQDVRLSLRVRCLNGTLPSGIQVRIIWETRVSNVKSQEGGLLLLFLPVPQESGNHSVYYEIDGGYGLSPSSGSISISLRLYDILASQGIGIEGFAISIMISLCATIPLIIKHRRIRE